jgi:excisionase family DNA binding protein
LIYRACAARRLRHVRLAGRALRFREAWLDAWLEAEAVEVAPLMEDRR